MSGRNNNPTAQSAVGAVAAQLGCASAPTPPGKESIRAEMRRRRANLPAEKIRQASAAAQARLAQLPEWTASRSVCCYLTAPGEIQTGRLLEDCRRHGRRICVPAFCRRRRAYFPAWLLPDSALTPGYGGIAEPRDPQWAPEDGRVDLAVVPGLAFDHAGTRLGHGGGHYDRLLALPVLRGAFKAGLAFEMQVVQELPGCPWDVAMDAVVTELGVYRKQI